MSDDLPIVKSMKMVRENDSPQRIKKTLYINIGKNDVYVEAFTIKKAADYWANFRVQKPAARLKIEVEYEEGEGVDD
jgi:hypothetical protein